MWNPWKVSLKSEWQPMWLPFSETWKEMQETRPFLSAAVR